MDSHIRKYVPSVLYRAPFYCTAHSLLNHLKYYMTIICTTGFMSTACHSPILCNQLRQKQIDPEIFIKAWKSLMNGLLIRDRVYARDGLHLNRFGTCFLYRCYEGTIKNIEGIMKL